MANRSPLILNPRAIPVVGIDHHLPAVPLEHLDAASVRLRFERPPAWKPEFAGDGSLSADSVPRAAAVLVPLLRHEGGLRVLLTRRTDHLHDHAGQVSFPGGRSDPCDVDAVATALREAHEEVGLEASRVHVIGSLPVYQTVTAYAVTPVVALVDPGAPLKLDAFEVAEAFEVPLAFLMNPAHHRRHSVEVDGLRREFLSMPWQGRGTAGEPREYFIWGATAAMLRNLYRFLSA
jgi:8-oxo-dGTP pyrophosphatase MutT (NUDIX family)